MNISRLAALAVIFMMVLSAFVAIPAYNASADHENHDDEEHDHDNGDGDHNSHHSEMVCYDIESHTVDMSYDNEEDCVDDGYMWVPSNSGPNGDMDDDNDEWRIQNFDVVFEMEDLANWLVTINAKYPIEESDRFREDVAEMCEGMMGGNPGEITKECYEHFLMIGDDDNHDDGVPEEPYCYDLENHLIVHNIGPEDCEASGYMWIDDDHEHNDDWSCPPGLTDSECEMMEDCYDNDMAGMTCQRMMYDYCNDNPGACGFDDDDSNFFFTMFAYEDGDITAEEFMANGAIQSMFEDDGWTDDDSDYDWGQGKYDFYTFTAESDGIVKIYSEFLDEQYESPSFICGNGDEIPFYFVNDYSGDCEDGADEQWYDSNTPNDTSDDCQMWNDDDCVGNEVNWFDCHDGNTVWITHVNNGEFDCYDGEDEYHNEYNYWYGNIFLLSGEFTGDSLGTELTPGHEGFMAAEIYNCYWGDDNKTFTDCSNFIPVNLVAGNTYTLVTAGECYSYDDEEMDCQTGNYMHTMYMQDGTSMNMSGNVTDDHPMADFSEVMSLDDGSILGNFVLYDERAFAVGEDGFAGTFVSYSTGCHDYDKDGEYDYCYGSSPSIYLYENFDSADTESGLVGSASTNYDDDIECPDSMEDCYAATMDFDLSPGNYTIVTAFNEGGGGHEILFINMVQTYDGTTVSDWDGKLHNAYYSYENGTETLVEGNDRIHMPYPEYDDFNCYDEYDNEIDCDEMFEAMILLFGLMENMTAYEDGDMNATMAADNIIEILNAMVDAGFFDQDEDHHDDHHDGSSMTLNYFDVSSWDSTNDLQQIVDWFNDEYYYDEDEEEWTVDDFLEMCDADPEYVDNDVAQCVLDEAISMLDDGHHDDDDNGATTPQDVLNWGDANNDSLLSFDEFVNLWAGGESDDHHANEDEGHHHHGDENIHHDHEDTDDDHTHSEDDRHHSHDDSEEDSDGPGLEEVMAMFNESDSNSDGFLEISEIERLIQLVEGSDNEYDDRDSDDTPALLDGIIGTQDPQNAGDNCRPSAEDPYLIGNIDDNAGHPLTCTFEFKLHFEGADESLDSHVAYIPFEAQDVWTLKMENTLGYEVTSCDNCEMGDDGVMSGTGPVTLTFSMAEPQPDCDVVVGLSADGMAFDPVKIAINVGETVCWQWKDAAMAHNVVELEGEYDSTSDLTAIDFGFSSGEPAMTVDFRHTFTEDNKVHYYVCAPHAQLGMVGQVTVGNGTDDPVQQAIEDEEVPSLGFVFGSLVLVGAAGLRRRIH